MFTLNSHFIFTFTVWDRGIFCPHFVQSSNSVSIRTIRLFHYSLPPQFLSVKWENLSYCLPGVNSKLVGFYQANGFLFTPVFYSTERNVKHKEKCDLTQGIVLIGRWLRSISNHWNCYRITVLVVVPIESILWQLCCTVRLGTTWDWQSCHTPAITRPPCAVAPT